MRLLTYNMLDAPGDRRAALAEVLSRLDPDVAVCQEITDVSGFIHLAAALGRLPLIAWANGPEVLEEERTAGPGGPHREHIGLLSRWPITTVRVHPGNPRVLFRSVLQASVEVPDGGRLTVIGLHLRSFPGPPGEAFKMREAEVCSTIIRDAVQRGATAVLGDFNAWVRGEGEPGTMADHYPADHVDAIRGGVTDVIRGAGVEDVRRLQGMAPDEVPGTIMHLGRRSPVDHIMVSAHLAARLVRVAVVDEAWTRDASDHLPLVADFR